ncbi:hypothetical protein QJS10_CPA01g00475 [Acorus calamus]|uniref:Uncharacterized protein n=1 Tax=Acorus calamus TaxID=4465 RepID=A0AAV9FHH1_ACOCL|nr:hypothetical protein QJS10_CPA01g00475 [Acorus calamus]
MRNCGRVQLKLTDEVSLTGAGKLGSAHLWRRRREFVRLWWRPNHARGHLWLDESPPDDETDPSLPPIRVSEDISRFRYTNPTGHPSGLRISRIVSESFRLGLPNVRWFFLCDDDTIVNVENLIGVLNKYDPSEMVYIGTPSESHSANTYFSHSMAFGGGGIAISYPLAEALSVIQDDCLERYPKLYGSDDRLHACISELGVPLSRELGFHQWDIRGNAHGLLAAHPVAPFVSIHHVEAVDPIYPGLSSLNGLKLFARAMHVEPWSFLQRSICYDRSRRLTFAVSLGYVIQVYPNIVLPRELERSEQTFVAWNRLSNRNEFDFDTRDAHRLVCKKPILFFLKDVGKDGNATIGLYGRAKVRDDLKRKRCKGESCQFYSLTEGFKEGCGSKENNVAKEVEKIYFTFGETPNYARCSKGAMKTYNMSLSGGTDTGESAGSFMFGLNIPRFLIEEGRVLSPTSDVPVPPAKPRTVFSPHGLSELSGAATVE